MKPHKREDEGTSARPSAYRKVLEVLDVVAKMIGALALFLVTILVHNHESKMHVTSLLNQREQAESELRAAMLHDLVQPIIGPHEAPSRDRLFREKLLVELLTLNFHNHFEFKPLLTEVDSRLAELADQNCNASEEKRKELQSVARRVIDRQTSMLRTVAESQRQPLVVQKLYFREAFGNEMKQLTKNATEDESDQPYKGSGNMEPQEAGPDDLTSPHNIQPGSEDLLSINSSKHPAHFNPISCTSVRVYSPDEEYKLYVKIGAIKNNEVEVYVDKLPSEEPINSTSMYRAVNSFWITHYDFPLTDNTQIDVNNRYAISLLEISEQKVDLNAIREAEENTDKSGDEGRMKPTEEATGTLKGLSREVVLQIVWFPKGYITVRERPMNYSEIRRVVFE